MARRYEGAAYVVKDTMVVNQKLTPLEGQRGIAAVIVFVHHFLLAFHPAVLGILPGTRSSSSLAGSPLFVLVNGTGAVFFFFTLSGFVLSWHYFQKPEEKSMLWAAVKRWPRLAGPVLLTTMVSVIMFHTGAFAFQEAGRQSGSTWLSTFAYSTLQDYQPALLYGLWQGLTTFFTGNASLNTSLWTMAYEYYGSLAVFALAPLLLRVSRPKAFCALAACITLTLIPLPNLPQAVAGVGSAFLFPFLLGLSLAFVLSRQKRMPETGLAGTIALVVVAIYLLGYHHASAAYVWVEPLAMVFAEEGRPQIYSIGSAVLICATMTGSRLFDALDRPLMSFLGRVSFPLYLVHVLIIASASSWLYTATLSRGGLPLFVATVLLALPLSLLVMTLDEWWVGKVNAAMAVLRRKFRSAERSTAPSRLNA